MAQTLTRHRLSLAKAKAAAFYRRNPQATLLEVSAACEVSTRTAWQARQQMVIEGVCKPNRRAGKSLAAPGPQELQRAAESTPEAPAGLLNAEQLALLAAGETGDLDDADPETRKRMLRELRAIAFGANHPDTRVTAMKAWFTLKDMASGKDLGPGNPMTFAVATDRLRALVVAAGLRLALTALLAAFPLMEILQTIEKMVRKDPVDEPPSTEAVEPAIAPPPTPESPLPPDDEPHVRGDQGADGSDS